MRKRIGFRRHIADIYNHNGTRDAVGQLDTKNDSNWVGFAMGWPCEFVSTVGGEIVRGIMVTDKSTHIAFGHFSHVETVNKKMRVKINNEWYGITSIIDPEGIRQEMRIELRKEN